MNRRPGPLRPNSQQLEIDWTAQEELPAAPPAPVALTPTNPPPELPAQPPARTEALRKKSRIKPRAAIGARVSACLPVPRPLPASVAAGHFGHDDDGKAIRPEADEIRAITESLADRLIGLLDAMKDMKQESARQAMQEQFTQAVQMYAMEFGERPARQLEAHVRRQSSLDEDDRRPSGWQR